MTPGRYLSAGFVGRRFLCYACGIGLRIRPSYFLALYFVALLCVVLGFYALGLRGMSFVSVVGVAVIPVWMLLIFVTIRIFPVDLEQITISDADALYFVADHEATWSEPPSTHGPASDSAEAPFSGRAPSFQQAEPTRIVDVVISVFLFVLIAYMASTVVIAVLDRVFPGPDEIKNAQAGFPLRAALRRDTIAFTNLSTEEWRCEVVLGSSALVSASFGLRSHQTQEIRYVDFRPSLLMIGAIELRSAAREELVARCTEPSGRFVAGLLR